MQCVALCQCHLNHLEAAVLPPACEHTDDCNPVAIQNDLAVDHCADHDAAKRPTASIATIDIEPAGLCFGAAVPVTSGIARGSPLVDVPPIARVLPLLT